MQQEHDVFLYPMAPITHRHDIQSTSPTTTTQQQTFPHPVSVMPTNQVTFTHPTSFTDTIQHNSSPMYPMATYEASVPYPAPHDTSYQQNLPHAGPLSTTHQLNYPSTTTSVDTLQQGWSHSFLPMEERTSQFFMPPATTYPRKVRTPIPSAPTNQNWSNTMPSVINQQNYTHTASSADTTQQNYYPMYSADTCQESYPYPTSSPETSYQSWSHSFPPMESCEQSFRYSMYPTTAYPQNVRAPRPPVDTRQYYSRVAPSVTNQQNFPHSIFFMDTIPQNCSSMYSPTSPVQTNQHCFSRAIPSMTAQQNFTYSVPPTTPHNQTFTHPTPVMPPLQQNDQHQILATTSQQSYPYPTSLTENYPNSMPPTKYQQPVSHSIPALSTLEKSQEVHLEEMPQYADTIFGGELSARGTQVWFDQLEEVEEVKTENPEFNPESEHDFEEDIKHLRAMISTVQAVQIATEMERPDDKVMINWCQQEICELKETVLENPRYSIVEKFIWDRSEESGELLTKDNFDDLLTTLLGWCCIDVGRILMEYLPSEQNLLSALERQFDEFRTSGTDLNKEEYEFLLTEICKSNNHYFELKAVNMIGLHINITPHLFSERAHCWRSACLLGLKWENQLLHHGVLHLIHGDETSSVTFRMITAVTDVRGFEWKKFRIYLDTALYFHKYGVRIR